MIENLHWDSLETRRTKSSLIMFYKMINNLAAIPYEHYVKPIPNSTTRHSHQHEILPLSSSKNAFKFSFIPRTIPIWNRVVIIPRNGTARPISEHFNTLFSGTEQLFITLVCM